MSYDVASFALIYNHNVARNQWPQEVPFAIRSERYAVVKLTSEISLTVWSLPGDASLERGVPVLWSLPGDASVERDVPVLCGRAPYRNNGAFYSSWVVFRARVQFAQFLVLDMKEELALESLVGEACCQQLFSACRVCCEHVWRCFYKPPTPKKPLTDRNVYRQISMKVDLKPKQVNKVAVAIVELAARQLTEVGHFNIPGFLNMKLKKTPFQRRHILHGPNVVSKITDAKPASQKLTMTPVKKFKEAVMS